MLVVSVCRIPGAFEGVLLNNCQYNNISLTITLNPYQEHVGLARQLSYILVEKFPSEVSPQASIARPGRRHSLCQPSSEAESSGS